MVARVSDKFPDVETGGIDFSVKADGSRVTALDLSIERDWREILAETFPEHAVVGEELGGKVGQNPFCWFLDPVDGTDDCSRGIPLFGYLVTLTRYGEPIAAATGHPQLGIHSRAVLGAGTQVNGRAVRLGSPGPKDDIAIAIPAMADFIRNTDKSAVLGALSLRFPNYRVYRNVFAHSCVLRGSLEAAVEFDVAPWDILATQLMVEEAAGEFRYFRRTVDALGVSKSGVAFGRPDVVDSICHCLAKHGYDCD